LTTTWVEDGICSVFIADKLGVSQPTAGGATYRLIDHDPKVHPIAE
jgi:hypothetical protein